MTNQPNKKICKGFHCRCMNIGGQCLNTHYADCTVHNELLTNPKEISSNLEEKIGKMFENFWGMSVDILHDNGAGSFGKYKMVKLETLSFILNACIPLAKEQARREAVEEIRRIIEEINTNKISTVFPVTRRLSRKSSKQLQNDSFNRGLNFCLDILQNLIK